MKRRALVRVKKHPGDFFPFWVVPCDAPHDLICIVEEERRAVRIASDINAVARRWYKARQEEEDNG